MRRFDIPVGPAVVGCILGPALEAQYRRAMMISQGDEMVLISRPISGTIFAIAAILFFGPRIWSGVSRYRRRHPGALAP